MELTEFYNLFYFSHLFMYFPFYEFPSIITSKFGTKSHNIC